MQVRWSIEVVSWAVLGVPHHTTLTPAGVHMLRFSGGVIEAQRNHSTSFPPGYTAELSQVVSFCCHTAFASAALSSGLSSLTFLPPCSGVCLVKNRLSSRGSKWWRLGQGVHSSALAMVIGIGMDRGPSESWNHWETPLGLLHWLNQEVWSYCWLSLPSYWRMRLP